MDETIKVNKVLEIYELKLKDLNKKKYDTDNCAQILLLQDVIYILKMEFDLN